uniref:Putative secreted protein n=1 Tax=Ixodes ricinus TaxID=34613 RepID=A0A6B0UBC9_IXORI
MCTVAVITILIFFSFFFFVFPLEIKWSRFIATSLAGLLWVDFLYPFGAVLLWARINVSHPLTLVCVLSYRDFGGPVARPAALAPRGRL